MGSKKASNKIDVVYVIGSGSHWDNNELRFSVRSVFKNLKGFAEIVIVGEKPPFLDGVIHIPYPDKYPPSNADGNIIEKVLQACSDQRVSEQFLFMNDDHIFIKPVKITEVPPFHRGCLTAFEPSYFKVNPWRERLNLTKLALEKALLPTLHFDCHTPILFSKGKFIEAMARFDYQSGVGLTMKSLYGNIHYRGAPRLDEEKKVVFSPHTLSLLEERFKIPYLLAFNDHGLNDSLKIFLYKNFQRASPLETIPLEDRIIDIYRSSIELADYQFAVDTFLKYFKNENIKNMVLMDRSQRFAHKLNYLFNQKLQNL